MRTPHSPVWKYLEMDGGWLTAEGIAMEVGMRSDSVYRSMWRWRQRGHVETRLIKLASIGGINAAGRNHRNLETRREWKTI